MSMGLTHNTALCLLEDQDGYIWIGTLDGLNKYDGSKIVTFKHVFGDSTSLINNHINCIVQAKNRDIWIGTANGLSKYDIQNKHFKSYQFKVDGVTVNINHIRTIFEDDNHILWIGTANGIIKFDVKNETYEYVLINPEIKATENALRIIFKDRNENILFGTDDGLFRFTNERFSEIELNVDNTEGTNLVREIVEDDNGFLWLGTEKDGIIILDYQQGSYKVRRKINSENCQISSNTIRSIFFENSTTVWAGTFEGLNIINLETSSNNFDIKSCDLADDVSHKSIRDIIPDSSGGIWVATYLGGVNYYNKQKNLFSHSVWFTDNNVSLNNNIVSVLKEDGNKLWMGTEGGGIYLSQDGGNSISKRINSVNSDLPHNSIKSLDIGYGKLWIGTLAGFSSYDLTTQKVRNYFHNKEDESSLLSGHVSSIYFENEERIWVVTLGGGLQLFNAVTNEFRTIPEFNGRNFTCSYFDQQKVLWMGTQNGVFAYDTKQGKQIDFQRRVTNWDNSFTHVSFITGDSGGKIWIGTLGKGLYLIRDNRLFWYNTANNLTDNSVNSLLEGAPNQYWIATNRGLSKIDLTETSGGEPKLNSVVYSATQGLQGPQFSPNCALKSNSGKLLFGGINGLNSFFHSDIKETAFQPRLILEELRIRNQLINPNNEASPLNKRLNDSHNITLKYDQREFSVYFTGINYINPEKNLYRYKIERENDQWTEIGNQDNINFTYFPVGTHEIKLQVSTNPNQWGAEYHSLVVTVLPPWWKTIWAFLIYTFVLSAMLIVFFMLSQRWAKMKNQLAMQQFQQDKENELYQLKLKFYTDVSHELRTPLTLILAPLENLVSKSDMPSRIKNQLLQIQRSGYRLMQLVNQILDLRKLETGHDHLQVAEGNIVKFLSEISLAFKEVATSKNIEFEFLPVQQKLMLWFDRDKLEIIINNLLSNAIKFTPSGKKVVLQLEKETDNRTLRINVTNEGPGIPAEELDEIYKRFYSKNDKHRAANYGSGVGLELTKRMVELHKGNIFVSSTDSDTNEKLTTFSISLPLGKEIYSVDEIDTEFRNSEDPSLYTNEMLQRELIFIDEEEDLSINNKSEHEEKLEKLLIVEDNPEVRNFVKVLFASTYEISEAENGETGLQKAIEINPHLIISDVMMPVMDGIEFCRRIKTDARTSHIPVILLTARTALTFKYEGLETGADEYITKPFSSKYLELRVKNLIKQRTNIQEHFKREAIFDPGNVTLTSIDEKILKKAVDYIAEHITDPKLNVNKLSAHIGLSRVHFYRKIKALTNQTAVEFIRSVRLKRAALLLEQNKLTIKEVQNMVGFEDANYFRDCFKEQFGVTPSEYASSKL
ncbi:two-component regulator propeller domain-containing protein [uncultured Draconibacterium sp.]|uniref:hybrid sensor histidine kinase/response regulator transcription factor n=1 Tax=uncultured Draconibacterium sp. TaxID=1573823 RepID=UPI0029C86E1B|nr:two-component regulator propeller domain-containing protein [uncultured Draconibacterium sp.]